MILLIISEINVVKCIWKFTNFIIFSFSYEFFFFFRMKEKEKCGEILSIVTDMSCIMPSSTFLCVKKDETECCNGYGAYGVCFLWTAGDRWR